MDLSSVSKDGATPGHLAAFGGLVATLELLSFQGVDRSSKDKDGSTPGHLAAGSGHGAALELLSTKGAHLSSDTAAAVTNA